MSSRGGRWARCQQIIGGCLEQIPTTPLGKNVTLQGKGERGFAILLSGDRTETKKEKEGPERPTAKDKITDENDQNKRFQKAATKIKGQPIGGERNTIEESKG